MVDAYAVFEGGGVKGSALVGALARAEEDGFRFKGFAGTSAGAIVAALAAVGYKAADLKTIMDRVDYTDFLDGRDRLPLDTLRQHQRDARALTLKLEALFEDLSGLDGRGAMGLWWKLYCLKKKYGQEIQQLRAMSGLLGELMEHKGIYESTTFYKWIRDLLSERGKLDQHGQVTFGTVSDADPITLEPRGTILKIVVTDLGKRGPRVYQPSETAAIEVAQAVQASMSIPLFFRPFPEGQHYLVDGGLLSNFPAWAFDKEKTKPGGDLPLLGFRLATTNVPDASITPIGMYAEALLRTAVGGTDTLQTRQVSKFMPVNIRTPADIPATKFDLEPQERKHLYKLGYDATEQALVKAENRKTLGLPPLA
jgi:NTE family protein